MSVTSAWFVPWSWIYNAASLGDSVGHYRFLNQSIKGKINTNKNREAALQLIISMHHVLSKLE